MLVRFEVRCFFLLRVESIFTPIATRIVTIHYNKEAVRVHGSKNCRSNITTDVKIFSIRINLL